MAGKQDMGGVPGDCIIPVRKAENRRMEFKGRKHILDTFSVDGDTVLAYLDIRSITPPVQPLQLCNSFAQHSTQDSYLPFDAIRQVTRSQSSS